MCQKAFTHIKQFMKIQILLFISFAFSVSIFSQNKTGIGNVSDNGTLIPNAIVQISPVSDTTVTYEYICDKNGNYEFDITSNESTFTLNLFPSAQTLQFTHAEEIIKLKNGNNEILYHNVDLTGNHGIDFTVTDTLGNPVQGAKVMLYDSKIKWKTDSCRIAKPVYTDLNGHIEINSLLPIKYWFNVKQDFKTNRFTTGSTTAAIDTTNTTDITIQIRDLKQNEFYMCGLCDNKTWVTDSMIVFGITLPYDADTKLLSDATWWDSNGRFGYWWFNSDETVMTYNYTDGTAGGTNTDATNLEITDSTWVGDMEFNGMQVRYFMSVHALDTINLSIDVQDTTIYLNSNGTASITPDDLLIKSDYCFTCNATLSKSGFNANDIGKNEVYVTIEDRCGNYAIDTLTLTVKAAPAIGINEMIKSDISLYPNPASSFIIIESNDYKLKRIEVFSVNGVMIKSFVVNTRQFSYRTYDLNKGVYIVKIYTSKDVVTKKLILK